MREDRYRETGESDSFDVKGRRALVSYILFMLKRLLTAIVEGEAIAPTYSSQAAASGRKS